MKTLFSHSLFRFTKSQRTGIFVFLLIVAVIQLFYYYLHCKTSYRFVSKNQVRWESRQLVKDTTAGQSSGGKWKIRPFNPNFISDFKGYQLGMTVDQLDRLFAYRKTNQYVNSAEEFQQITQISDAQLKRLAPYFKFPPWVSRRNEGKAVAVFRKEKEAVVLKDINAAQAEDLKKIYGIGDRLAERILKERSRLGVFVSMEQLKDVYGLSPEVIARLHDRFAVVTSPQIHRIQVNRATIKELMEVPYFKYSLARNIVAYRSMNGHFSSCEDLTKISGFPVDRMNIIALYLEF